MRPTFFHVNDMSLTVFTILIGCGVAKQSMKKTEVALWIQLKSLTHYEQLGSRDSWVAGNFESIL